MHLQVECADVVLLNRCDLLSHAAATAYLHMGRGRLSHAGAAMAACPTPTPTPTPDPGSATQQADPGPADAIRRAAASCVATVKALNPGADVRVCAHCEVPPGLFLRRRGDGRGGGGEQRSGGGGQHAAGTAHAGDGGAVQGHVHVHEEEHVPETEAYDLRSVVFEAPRPFHPQRGWALLQALAHAAQDSGSGSSSGRGGGVGRGAAGAPGGSDAEAAREAEARARLTGVPPLLRAKGILWVASMPDVSPPH